jgi:hypothetical protein
MEEKKYILSELDKLSPMLKAMKTKDTNTDPGQSYFDDLQDRVMSHVNLDNASKLEKKGDVPKDYFEILPDVILSKINEAKAKRVSFVLFQKWPAIAASLLIVLMALPFVTRHLGNLPDYMANNTKVNVSESISNDLTDEDIDYIIHKYGSEEDLDLIKSIEVDKSALSIESLDADEVDVNLTEEDLEYLNSIM